MEHKFSPYILEIVVLIEKPRSIVLGSMSACNDGLPIAEFIFLSLWLLSFFSDKQTGPLL